MYNISRNNFKNFIFLMVCLIICLITLTVNYKIPKNMPNKKIIDKETVTSSNNINGPNNIDNTTKISLNKTKNQKDFSNSQKQITQNIKQIKTDNKTIKENNLNSLKKSVFLGDSITEGFRVYKVLDNSNVVAKKGLSIYGASSYVKKTISINPNNVFILLGVNDIVDSNLTPERFIKQYSNLVTTLKKGLPDSKIYVLSVLPVNQNAQQKQPSLSNIRIKNFNSNLKSMCNKLDVNFIDITPPLIKNNSYYQGDGIHLKSNFYPILLNYIKNHSA